MRPVYVSRDTDIFPIGVNIAASADRDIALCLYSTRVVFPGGQEGDTLWRFVPAASVLTAALSVFGLDVKSLGCEPTPNEKELAGTLLRAVGTSMWDAYACGMVVR